MIFWATWFLGQEKLRGGRSRLYRGRNTITGNRDLFSRAQVFECKLAGVDFILTDNKGIVRADLAGRLQ